MSYRVGPTHYVNFGPFCDEWMDFSQPGLTVIEGIIEGEDTKANLQGGDSNGAGKSYLFDGPAWAVWGRCIRPDYSGDDIIRTELIDGVNVPVKGGTSVETNFVGGPVPVKVTRYRRDTKHGNAVRLEVDGVDVTAGTNAETTALAEQHLGLDFSTFCNVIAFGVREDVKSFYTATDTDRKKICDTLIGLEVYTKAEKVARQRLAKKVSALSELRTKFSMLETRLVTKRELMAQVLQSGDMEDREFQLRLQQAALKVLRKRVTRHDTFLNKLEGELEKETGVQEGLNHE